jgi:curved DNA binding protein
MKCFLYR